MFLQIAQLPEAGQASDKAIPPRSSCRQDQYYSNIFTYYGIKHLLRKKIKNETCPKFEALLIKSNIQLFSHQSFSYLLLYILD